MTVKLYIEMERLIWLCNGLGVGLSIGNSIERSLVFFWTGISFLIIGLILNLKFGNRRE